MMLKFAKLKTFEDAFRFIQQNSEIVSREYSDHLMARAFKLEMDGKSTEAKACARWSLALSYCFQMGKDGVGLFFKRYAISQHTACSCVSMLSGGPAAVQVFETDLEGTYARIRERSKILRDKRKQESDQLDENNSNLTPEQSEAFNAFPKYFQDALFSNDIDQINAAFAKMDETLAADVMAKCQATGLISLLSEEEAQQMQ
jgi:cell division cycle protein 37